MTMKRYRKVARKQKTIQKIIQKTIQKIRLDYQGYNEKLSNT